MAVTVEGGELVGIAPAILQVGIVERHKFVLVAVVPSQSATGRMYPKLAIDVFDYHLIFARIDYFIAIYTMKDKVAGRVGRRVEMHDTRLVGSYPQLAVSVDVDVVNRIVAQRLAIGCGDVLCFVERQRNEEEAIGGGACYEASRWVTTQELDGGTGVELVGLHFTIALADMQDLAVS